MGTKPSKIALLISGVFSLTALPTMAAETNQDITIDEIITVTGTRFDRSSEQQLTVINTIERSEIERFNPKSIVDVLENLPGVSVTRSGGAAQTSSVSIRGAGSDHALVIVDGVKIGSATLGSASFSTISPENIERIEVLKGPRASVWGSDAIGGVIQIFTRQLKSGEWYVGAEYGSNDYVRGSAGVGLEHGQGSSTLAVNHERSNGYDIHNGAEAENDADGYDRTSLSLKGSQSLSEQWQALWNAQYDKGNTKYDDTFGSGGNDEYDYNNYLWTIGAQYSAEQYSSKLTLSQSRDYNEQFRDDKSLSKTVKFETKRKQVNWINQYLVGNGLNLSGGIDWSNEAVLGDYKVTDRDLIGVYLHAEKQWDKLLAEVAVRYDDVEDVDSETTYNLGLAYQFDAQWRLAVTTGTGFKVPTFNDLYYPNLGNPALLSETSENYDFTLNYQHNDVQAYISLFRNDLENLIDWAPTGEVDENGWDIYKPSNIDDAKILGGEFYTKFPLFGLEHQLAYTYLDTEDKTTKEKLTGRSESEVNYSLSYQWDDFDFLVNYHYHGKRYAGGKRYLGAYSQLDLSVGYQVADNWQLRLKANNVFDEDIMSVTNYNSPGRELFFSVSYSAF